MNDPVPPKRIFPDAKVDAKAARHVPSSPQTESAAYKLAFQDAEFLLRRGSAARPLPARAAEARAAHERSEDRIDLRLLRLGENSGAFDGRCAGRGRDRRRAARRCRAAEGQVALLRRREEAGSPRQHLRARRGRPAAVRRLLGRRARRSWRRRTAARSRKASRRSASTSSFRTSSCPTVYVTPDLSFQFHYFALRKMHFLLRARAVAVFPGGFGTFDEFFELLTLIQTGKVRPLPVLLFGRDFWTRVVNFEALVEEGVICPARPRDLPLVRGRGVGLGVRRALLRRASGASAGAECSAGINPTRA